MLDYRQRRALTTTIEYNKNAIQNTSFLLRGICREYAETTDPELREIGQSFMNKYNKNIETYTKKLKDTQASLEKDDIEKALYEKQFNEKYNI